jgi:hypothetical protein
MWDLQVHMVCKSTSFGYRNYRSFKNLAWRGLRPAQLSSDFFLILLLILMWNNSQAKSDLPNNDSLWWFFKIRTENHFLKLEETIFLPLNFLIYFRESLLRISQESFFLILQCLTQLPWFWLRIRRWELYQTRPKYFWNSIL